MDLIFHCSILITFIAFIKREGHSTRSWWIFEKFQSRKFRIKASYLKVVPTLPHGTYANIEAILDHGKQRTIKTWKFQQAGFIETFLLKMLFFYPLINKHLTTIVMKALKQLWRITIHFWRFIDLCINIREKIFILSFMRNILEENNYLWNLFVQTKCGNNYWNLKLCISEFSFGYCEKNYHKIFCSIVIFFFGLLYIYVNSYLN